ncbi:MAG: hypothetical protein WDN66_04925 [Candidatus Saccharibacteria bacterium]
MKIRIPGAPSNAFNQCELKSVATRITVSLDGQAKLECPSIEDGRPDPGWVKDSTNHQPNESKRRRSAVNNLAKICGAQLCSTCIYKGVDDPLTVESIRQQSALDAEELARQRLITAETRLNAESVEQAALQAELAPTQDLFQLPVVE